jgi:ssDNA-binding Zn-finger/Zn-ribbon topoisomerase 1
MYNLLLLEKKQKDTGNDMIKNKKWLKFKVSVHNIKTFIMITDVKFKAILRKAGYAKKRHILGIDGEVSNKFLYDCDGCGRLVDTTSVFNQYTLCPKCMRRQLSVESSRKGVHHNGKTAYKHPSRKDIALKFTSKQEEA